MNGVKVIFFDMGNTLLHFHYGASDDKKDMQGLIYLTKYLKKFNAKILFEDVNDGFYECWMRGINHRKITLIEYPIENFLNNFLEKYQLKFNLNQCIETINLFYTEYKEQVCFETNLYNTLKLIKDKGYKIGIISNTCYYDEVMKECFKKAKIYDLIDSFTFSYSLKICKPNKQIFINAIELMGITPVEAVMVGDSLECDIKPALDLGMKTIWFNFNNNNSNGDIVADFKIACIAEVHDYI
ncbi:HAD family hydrolase [Clostridium estertheticum]|uniref:HAD family hydrolase n=1 Tax=Clostridium estertheticum TaxID=238834 RepID=UPI001CF4A87E|nr:HAD family hydrolase [Clostridium estertheticum]MCB2309352.1 HAD family hydrolase [Clostridium estertheticum]MCB2347766.1 HAD family hydrolase [Clostridium estertheticum]MCB2352325.1 HAD family hydrolase [Clostridium estertheticum]WAG44759.1 HAD family hydrolase [Clostridium estertheticum]